MVQTSTVCHQEGRRNAFNTPDHRPDPIVLLDADGTNFVASGPPQWHEDEGSYRDPCYFHQMLMR
jgi:hypothetical protein